MRYAVCRPALMFARVRSIRTDTDGPVAAADAGDIAATIASVSGATQRTTATVAATRHAADDLAATAGQLQALVSRLRH